MPLVIQFFQIEAGSEDDRFKEMQEITPAQAVEAIAWTDLYGGEIELYINDLSTNDTPLIGFVFKDGAYTGTGLGDDRTKVLRDSVEDRLNKKLIEFGEDDDSRPSQLPPIDFDGGWCWTFTRALAV